MIRVNRAALLQKLEAVLPGTSTRDMIEQGNSFVFKNGRIYTFNDEVACIARSPIEDKTFTGAVQATPLLAILQKLEEEEVELDVVEGELIISGKRRKAGIRMDAEIHLPIDKLEVPKEWTPLHEDFVDAVSIVQECAGNDETKFILTCVHIHPKWVEACDNFQISRYKIKTGVKDPALVRRNAIKHIKHLGVTEFAETREWIHFRSSIGMQISCRRYIESFPDISPLIVMDDGNEINLPKGLAEACDKADIFSSENGDNNQVMVTLKPGKLYIKGQGASGWYSEVKKVSYAGEEFSFMISPKLLSEITKKHNTCRVSATRLKVGGGAFQYVTCLGKPE